MSWREVQAPSGARFLVVRRGDAEGAVLRSAGAWRWTVRTAEWSASSSKAYRSRAAAKRAVLRFLSKVTQEEA